jgi:hypothetical protein
LYTSFGPAILKILNLVGGIQNWQENTLLLGVSSQGMLCLLGGR